MAINLTDFFTKAGKAFHAGNTILTAARTTVPAEVEDFTQEFGATTPIADLEAIEPVRAALINWQETVPGFLAEVVRDPIRQLLVSVVAADNPQPSDSVEDALAELIRQMSADSVDASAVAATATNDGGNTGDGVIVLSVKSAKGEANEHALAEDIEASVTAVVLGGEANILLRGEQPADVLSVDWPAGSGTNSTLTSYVGGSGANLVTTGDVETADDVISTLPNGWIVAVGTVGTTVKLSLVEQQTVAMTGTPTAGWYTLTFTNKAGKAQTTIPLAYNAGASDVQAALRALIGLEEITVSTAGTTPNYTHTITFTGVPNPGVLTSTDNTTGGTHAIGHATTVAGSAYSVRGARAVEFDSTGADNPAVYIALDVAAATQYAVNLFAAVDVVPAAGVFTVDLVDGIGGSVINDDAGTANSFTFTAAGLTTTPAAKNGAFRTPTALPALVFLRIRASTAVSSGTSSFIDEVCVVPMTELYAGGVFAAVFTGGTEWIVGDRSTVAVTNDRAGAIHEWLNRVFDLRESRLLIPSDAGGTETINDSLIA